MVDANETFRGTGPALGPIVGGPETACDVVVSIALSTYNGARYLDEQLESLMAQRLEEPFEIVVRDDGSTDETRDILVAWARARPNVMRIIDDGSSRLGPMQSFTALLRHARGRYVAFCDQDDYWKPDKLAQQLSAIRNVERLESEALPILCCSDAAVTDERLNVTHSSYFSRHSIRTGDGRDLSLARLIFRNYAIGATTMINRALAVLCEETPETAVMHDWWAALLACTLGRTIVLQDALILYRQHGANAIGSRRRKVPRSASQLSEYLSWARHVTARGLAQAAALRDAQQGSLSPEIRRVLDQYASFSSAGKFQRLETLLRTGGFKPGIALNSLHLYVCLTTRFSSR